MKYEKFKNVGILTIEHFIVGQGITMDMWKKCIDSLAVQIQKDKIKKLLIDVSRNGGGNSKVGELLIAYFCHQPYRTYSCTWRRSDEYVDFMKSMGQGYRPYESLGCGEYYIVSSKMVQPRMKTKPFRGKLWVAVGDRTFSSVIIFATLIKDNKLACLIGETPREGHPNHFGEMIILKTPKTGLNFGFGVKQFIRPSGELENNLLEPDVRIDPSKIKMASDWLPYLK